jgi:hypothetical protein
MPIFRGQRQTRRGGAGAGRGDDPHPQPASEAPAKEPLYKHGYTKSEYDKLEAHNVGMRQQRGEKMVNGSWVGENGMNQPVKNSSSASGINYGTSMGQRSPLND